MAFFRKKLTPADEGRVYIFRITLEDGTILHKVGVCFSDRSTDRLMEVLRGFFTVYRYVPHSVIKKDKKFELPLLVEKHLHSLLDDLHYKFDKSFSGSTEFYANVDEEALIEYVNEFDYMELLKHPDPMPIDEHEAILKVIRKDSDESEVPF